MLGRRKVYLTWTQKVRALFVPAFIIYFLKKRLLHGLDYDFDTRMPSKLFSSRYFPVFSQDS